MFLWCVALKSADVDKVTIWGETPDGAKTQLILYATPTRPGWTRLIARQVSCL